MSEKDDSKIEIPAEQDEPKNDVEEKINEPTLPMDIMQPDNEDQDSNDLFESQKPVVEEFCIKKFAYVTTDGDDEPTTSDDLATKEAPDEVFEGKRKIVVCFSKFYVYFFYRIKYQCS